MVINSPLKCAIKQQRKPEFTLFPCSTPQELSSKGDVAVELKFSCRDFSSAGGFFLWLFTLIYLLYPCRVSEFSIIGWLQPPL